jgi:hypothetical protein
LAISVLGWLDLTDNCAYILQVEQPPPTPPEAQEEQRRMATSVAQLTRVVQHHALSPLPDVSTDGSDSTTKFRTGVRALKLQQSGQLRADAKLRDLYDGPPRSGPGRPQRADGKVRWPALSRFERLDGEDEQQGL